MCAKRSIVTRRHTPNHQIDPNHRPNVESGPRQNIFSRWKNCHWNFVQQLPQRNNNRSISIWLNIMYIVLKSQTFGLISIIRIGMRTLNPTRKRNAFQLIWEKYRADLCYHIHAFISGCGALMFGLKVSVRSLLSFSSCYCRTRALSLYFAIFPSSDPSSLCASACQLIVDCLWAVSYVCRWTVCRSFFSRHVPFSSQCNMRWKC